ncbi:MAG: hypothetical protein ACPGFA_09225 [Pikeienuella sp.]
MTTETPLDRAWSLATDETAGEGGMARFYDVFAATELFLLIDPASLDGGAATGGRAPQPILFPVDEIDTALVFDTEARLADFMEDGAAHLTLSGRAVIEMFAGKNVQLGVNLGDAPSATILPTEAIEWASSALRQPIEAELDKSVTLTLPRGVLPTLLTALDAKLAGMGAVVAEAWLCGTGGGRRSEGLILCLVMRVAGAEHAAVAALAETARFAGGDKAAFDIAVLASEAPCALAHSWLGVRRNGRNSFPRARPAKAPIATGV